MKRPQCVIDWDEDGKNACVLHLASLSTLKLAGYTRWNPLNEFPATIKEVVRNEVFKNFSFVVRTQPTVAQGGARYHGFGTIGEAIKYAERWYRRTFKFIEE